MKKIIVLFLWIGVFGFSFSSRAYELWHTANGNTYKVHVALKIEEEKPGSPTRGSQTRGSSTPASQLYVLSYQTKFNLKDSAALQTEFQDLLTHFYYFHLPVAQRGPTPGGSTRGGKDIITIEAFKIPQSSGMPSVRFTKKISDLKATVDKGIKKNADHKNRTAAFEHFNRREFRAAIASFSKIKRKVPHDFSQMANGYLRLGQREEGTKQLELGLKEYPRDVTLLNNMAMTTLFKGTYVLKGRYEYDPKEMKNARIILEKAIKIDPTNWVTRANMALAETHLQNFKGAEKLYLEALGLSGGNAELKFYIGNFYHRQRQFEKAKPYYESALSKLKSERGPAADFRKSEIQKRLQWVKERKIP